MFSQRKQNNPKNCLQSYQAPFPTPSFSGEPRRMADSLPRYDVTWESLQSAAAVSMAPFCFLSRLTQGKPLWLRWQRRGSGLVFGSVCLTGVLLVRVSMPFAGSHGLLDASYLYQNSMFTAIVKTLLLLIQRPAASLNP